MEKDCQIVIAVLLTVYNRRETTLKCLEKLISNRLSSTVAINVYMIDDGCTDGTPEAVNERYPQVHIIKGNGNLYWNRGMWTAWNEAAKGSYDYYLWLNDDTYLHPEAIGCLLAAAQEIGGDSIIVGATSNKEGDTLTYGGRIKGKIPSPSGKPVEVDYFNGNIVLVPKNVFEKVGNLDYYFTHSKGDFDYGLRARKKGIRLFQAGKAVGICDAHQTMDKWCDPNVPVLQRWKAMWKPNGMPPHETFHLESRHYGMIPATFHFCSIILRCIYPKIWMRKR